MRFVWLVLALAGCAPALPVSHFAGMQPDFDPLVFWTGHKTSWGVIENRAGAPTETIVTDCHGTPDGADSLHMVQTLTEGDGTTTHRDWHLRRLDAQHFTATANDMAGEASGTSAGRVFHWRWIWRRPGPLGSVTMDQWMYAEPGGTMVNRTTIRKLGIIVAEVTEQFAAVP
jgi:hypothetical protein